jgi:hypothetical protein
MKQGAVLQFKVALASRAESAGVGAAGNIDSFLGEILFRTHCVARASAPLMRAACVRAAELAPSDGVANAIIAYLNGHIQEEQEHADWVLEDLEALGYPRAVTLARLPPSTLAELVGAQSYWIHHVHPVAVLAYIAVLEHRVTPLALLREAMAKSQLPVAGFRTLFEHAKLDPSHVTALYELIDELPLSAQQVALLSSNAFQSIRLLDRSFEEVFDAPGQEPTRVPGPGTSNRRNRASG